MPLPSFAPTFRELLHQEIVQRLVVYFYFWPIFHEELKFHRLNKLFKFLLSKSVSTHHEMISYKFRAMIEFLVF